MKNDYLTPLSVTSQQPPKFRSFNDLLYFDIVYKHLSVTCLLPSKFRVFICRNFFIKINMQFSDIATQNAKSTSSSLLWWRANASMAPVVNHEHRASFSIRKLLQWRITGCKHFADKFLHWLRFRLSISWFFRNIGINSLSLIHWHRLKFNKFKRVQVLANTWKCTKIMKFYLNRFYIISCSILTLNVCGEKPLFISFNDFNLAKYISIICRQVRETQRKLKHSRIVKNGITLATNISSQYKSNTCVFLFIFIA